MEKVAELLARLADMYEKKGDEYRARAFKRVIPRLAKFKSPEEARKVKGVGEGIMKRIREAWDTGTLKELVVIPMGEIRMDPYLRDHLVAKGIRTVEELRRAIENGSATLNLPHRIKILAKYHGRLRRMIPRDEITKVVTRFGKEVIICGSYRRGKPYSKDIDLLIVSDERGALGRFVKNHEGSVIVDHLTPHLDKLRSKYMGIMVISDDTFVRIDIRQVPVESKGAALLYFTGPASLNERMRAIAKKKGMLLNEYGLWNGDTRIASRTEQEIFAKLGMQYVQPEGRV